MPRDSHACVARDFLEPKWAALRILNVVVSIFLLCGCGTYGRMLLRGFSGVEDYRIFPGREIQASPQPFVFSDKTKEKRISDHLSIPGHDATDLETILRGNGTLAFLVIQDDALLYERYYNGFTRESIYLGFSMTKSVLSLLVGCAIEDGMIGSVEDPITRYLPELRGHGFEKVTIRHLLMSTSGLDYVENDNPFGIHAYMYYCEKCIERQALAFRLAEEPGSRFVYKSGDNILLATALRRALHGETITAYLQRRVWNPLGMESGGIWSTDGEQEKSWCCLAATAKDFAKIGMLYLRGGQWTNGRIVNEEWVRNSTTVTGNNGASWKYQFQWWHPFRDNSQYMMSGHLGQYVFVNPETQVVVVRLGTNRGGLSSQQWQDLLAFVSDAVLP